MKTLALAALAAAGLYLFKKSGATPQPVLDSSGNPTYTGGGSLGTGINDGGVTASLQGMFSSITDTLNKLNSTTPTGVGGNVALGMATVPVHNDSAVVAAANTTAISNDQIRGWLASNPGATDSAIKAEALTYGVTPQRLADATGGDLASILKRWAAA